jgi:tryptophan-rich sensory protein
MDWLALGLSAGLCVAMGAAEGMLSGSDLHRRLASLKLPRLYPPLWVWIVVALLTYVLQGAIAYRLLQTGPSLAGALALALLIVLMGANVAYNVILDRRRDPRLAYTGLIWFLPPLAAFEVALVFSDPVAAVLNLIYVAWVIGFDLPVMRALSMLNTQTSARET